jgi:hypothetical protein
VTNDVTPGSTLNVGTLTTGDAALHRGLHAFDAANDAWQWIPKPRNLCFDQDDNTCRKLVINWAPDSTDGTYYSLGGNDVHLAADDPNSAITVVHEIGHAVMDDVYNDAYPATPSCNPHSITGTSSQGCAWTEGFAEWFPAMVYNDKFFRWPNGGSLDLENASWGNGWGEGDSTEGRVAGAMIDISTLRTRGTGTATARAATRCGRRSCATCRARSGSSGASARPTASTSTSSGALASVYQNTIDYGFRDPLANYVQLARPRPVPAHNFRYATSSSFWSGGCATARSGFRPRPRPVRRRWPRHAAARQRVHRLHDRLRRGRLEPPRARRLLPARVELRRQRWLHHRARAGLRGDQRRLAGGRDGVR